MFAGQRIGQLEFARAGLLATLAKVTHPLADALAPWPFLRAASFRLPHVVLPVPKPYGHALAFNEQGQILADLGIHDMILLTNSHRNIVAIEGYGLNIVGERPILEG